MADALAPDAGEASARPFVEAYVTGWSMKERPASAVPLDGITDVVLFSVLPRPDGSIDATTNGLTDARVAAMKARAPRTLLAIGGERSAPMFRAGARIAPALAEIVERHGLDGVVLDIEPLAAIDPDTLASLVRALRVAIAPKPLSAVVAPDRAEIARLAPVARDLERVMIMSYLGEPDAASERLLVDALVGIGIARSAVGLGIGPKTSPAATQARLEAVRGGLAGGISLWGVSAASSRL